MAFETKSLLAVAESLPTDEYSISSASREFSGEMEARAFLHSLKPRLRDIGEWNKRSALSSYELFDGVGRHLENEKLDRGQFIKITLTGSGKSDWVQVERVFETDDELVITVKPTFDPTSNPQNTGEVSHFFSARSRNNFCATREGSAVTVYVIGLNEKLNSNHTAGLLETARNTAVANLGYYLGIQKGEWKKFCESFVTDPNNNEK